MFTHNIEIFLDTQKLFFFNLWSGQNKVTYQKSETTCDSHFCPCFNFGLSPEAPGCIKTCDNCA